MWAIRPPTGSLADMGAETRAPTCPSVRPSAAAGSCRTLWATATGFTTVLGHRVSRTMRDPAPAVTVRAGLRSVRLPRTTWASMTTAGNAASRPSALVSVMAVPATAPASTPTFQHTNNPTPVTQ